jgi:hypothetical protein
MTCSIPDHSFNRRLPLRLVDRAKKPTRLSQRARRGVALVLSEREIQSLIEIEELNG